MTILDILNYAAGLSPVFLVGLTVGGGTSSTDTSFERSGTSESTQNHVVPSALASLLASLGQASSVPVSASNNQSAVLNGIMTQPETVPNRGTVDGVITQDPHGSEGFEALKTMSGIDPYSSDYQTDTTDAYQRRTGEALAGMQSGPTAVRGATERVPLMQGQAAVSAAEGRGEEVRKATTQQAGITQQAAQLLQMFEQARKAASLGAQQQLFQQLYGIKNQKLQGAAGVDSARASSSTSLDKATQWLSGGASSTTDNLKGKGAQGSSHIGGEMGTNCCFIFLQHFNGILPWFIDMARHDYYTPRRQRGYKWMSRWLVPRMRRSKLWALGVNAVIIKPFLSYGSWKYKAGSKMGWLWKPYCHTWLNVWNMIGGAL